MHLLPEDLNHPFEIDDVHVRRVTLGVSLLDCASQLPATVKARSYDKVRRTAGSFVRAVQDVVDYYGISCDKLELSVTPLSLIADSLRPHEFTSIAQSLDTAAKDIGIDTVLGFSAVHPITARSGSRALSDAIPSAVASTTAIHASLDWGNALASANIPSIMRFAEIIEQIATLSMSTTNHFLRVRCGPSARHSSLYHAVESPDVSVSVEVSCRDSIKRIVNGLDQDVSLEAVEMASERIAFRAVRSAQFIGEKVARALSTLTGIDVELGRFSTSTDKSAIPANGAAAPNADFEENCRESSAPASASLAAVISAALSNGAQNASGGREAGTAEVRYERNGVLHSASVQGRHARIIAVHESATAVEIAGLVLESVTAPGYPRSVPISVVVSSIAPGETLRLPHFGSVVVSSAEQATALDVLRF